MRSTQRPARCRLHQQRYRSDRARLAVGAGQPCGRPGVGAVGAKLIYADGKIQHAGVILGVLGVAGHTHKGFDRHDYGYFSRLQLCQNLSCVTAACMVMSKDVFERIGGFDANNLAVAFNDVDLCIRIRRKGIR